MLPFISLVVPSYNGRSLLEKNLPGFFKALEAYPGGGEVIVVDDGSSDGTVEFLGRFPVRVVRNSENLGFSRSCNVGVSLAKGEVIALINNDVELPRGFSLAELVKRLDDGVFSVGPLSYRGWDGKDFEGFFFPVFRRGMFRFGGEKEIKKRAKKVLSSGRDVYTFFLPGSFMVFKKSFFMSLGGFDEIYSPFYWEDVDLCFSAWRRGFPSVLTPSVWVVHPRKGTIKPNPKVKAIRLRNRLVFNTKNTLERGQILSFFTWLILRCSYKIDSVFRNGVSMYLKKLGKVFEKRRFEALEKRLSFRDIKLRILKSLTS